jgi:hypothetical protein
VNAILNIEETDHPDQPVENTVKNVDVRINRVKLNEDGQLELPK